MNKKSFNIILLLVFATIVFFAGCKDSINTSEIDSLFIPSVNVSYNQHLQPVFTAKCNYSGCHNSEDAAGGLMLTSWATTTANVSVVFPGEPENSILVWAVRGEAGSRNMPPVGSYPLTQSQIEGIEVWVAEGAKAN